MKHIRLYLTTLVAAFMAACSSMEVDDNELYSENFPKDFVDSVYMELHPELRAIQIKNYVKNHNAALKDSLSEEAYNKLMTDDTTAFFGDTAALHQLFVDHYCMGFSEEAWEDTWTGTVSLDSNCTTTRTYKQVFLIIGSDTTKILVDSVIINDKGNFEAVYGHDTTTTESKKYTIGESVEYFNRGTVYDSTVTCEVTENKVDGSLTAINKALLSDFNLYDAEDDMAAIKKIPVDMEAIAYQFLMYGRMNGWAYRKCTSEEKANPMSTLKAGETTNKLYCSESDTLTGVTIVREIK